MLGEPLHKELHRLVVHHRDLIDDERVRIAMNERPYFRRLVKCACPNRHLQSRFVADTEALLLAPLDIVQLAFEFRKLAFPPKGELVFVRFCTTQLVTLCDVDCTLQQLVPQNEVRFPSATWTVERNDGVG